MKQKYSYQKQNQKEIKPKSGLLDKFVSEQKPSFNQRLNPNPSGRISSELKNLSESNNNNMAAENSQTRHLMKWKELLQIDIISLCVSYSVVRYSNNASASLIAMNAATLFKWPVSWISWLTIAGAGSNFLLITLLIKFRVFKGLKRNYFFFLSALNITMFMFAVMSLPRIVNIKTYTSQMFYLAFQIIAKGWAYFVVHSAGKILLFNTSLGCKSWCFSAWY